MQPLTGLHERGDSTPRYFWVVPADLVSPLSRSESIAFITEGHGYYYVFYMEITNALFYTLGIGARMVNM